MTIPNIALSWGKNKYRAIRHIIHYLIFQLTIISDDDHTADLVSIRRD